MLQALHYININLYWYSEITYPSTAACRTLGKGETLMRQIIQSAFQNQAPLQTISPPPSQTLQSDGPHKRRKAQAKKKKKGEKNP